MGGTDTLRPAPILVDMRKHGTHAITRLEIEAQTHLDSQPYDLTALSINAVG